MQNPPMINFVVRNILSRLLASAVVVVGFYLLWLGFVESNVLKAVPGGALILAGLFLMVSGRRSEIGRERNSVLPPNPDTEDQI